MQPEAVTPKQMGVNKCLWVNQKHTAWPV